MLGIKRLMSW